MHEGLATNCLRAAIQVLRWSGGSRILRLGSSTADQRLAIERSIGEGLSLSTIDLNEPLESMYGAPNRPRWIVELEHRSEPIDLMWIALQTMESQLYTELLDCIGDAIKRLHGRSLILIEDLSHTGSRTEPLIGLAESTGYWLLAAGQQSLLISDELRRQSREMPDLPVSRFDRMTFDEAIQLQRRGVLWQAQRVYERLLRQNSGHTGALHLLGLVHHQRGDQTRARELIGQAIAREPRNAVLYNNYGAAHQSAGSTIEALGCFTTAVSIRPKYADALSNLGNVWETLGQLEQAEIHYRQALESSPKHLDSLRRLGTLLTRRGQRKEAAELLERAAQTDPKSAGIWAELGNLYMIDTKAEKASAAYRRSLELRPQQAATRFNYAASLAQQELIEEARQECRAACQLAPQRPIWRLREMVLCPTVFPSSQAIDEYRAEMGRQLNSLIAEPPQVEPKELVNIDFYPPFALSFQGREHRPLKEQFAALVRKLVQPLNASPPTGQKPKVGFVVTRGHEGGFIRGTAGIAARLNRQLLDVVILCPECSEPPLRKAIQGTNVEIVTFEETLDAAVETIAKANCHVLYYWEVGTDALNYMLPFYRLAPVQVTAWGTQVTTGMTEVDYYLSSSLIETVDADRHYTERLMRFETMPTFQSRIAAKTPVGRGYFGLPDNRPVYLCPQTILKLHPEQDRLFAQVLAADPRGILAIKEGQHPAAVQVLRERMRKSFGPLYDRVVFIPWQTRDDYFRLLTQADVVLDTHYFSAGSTSYDIFSYNQPIVTLPGIWNIGRYTLACYRKMGVEGLVADSPEKYAEIAVRLANDRAWQQSIRREIKENSAAIFTDPLTVAEHEQFFLEKSQRG